MESTKQSVGLLTGYSLLGVYLTTFELATVNPVEDIGLAPKGSNQQSYPISTTGQV